MKKILILIFLLSPVLLYSQFSKTTMGWGSGWGFVSSGAIDTDSTLIGLMSYWNTLNENNKDSATWNSTGITVVSQSSNDVVVSDASSFYVGNGIMFGSASESNYYNIIAINVNTLTFSTSPSLTVTDELFIASNGSFIDTYGGYTATQSTAIYQPDYLWLGTDSVRFLYAGSRVGQNFTNYTLTRTGTYTVSLWLKDLGPTGGYGSYDFVMSHNVRTHSSLYFLSSGLFVSEGNSNGDLYAVQATTKGAAWQSVTFTIDSGTTKLYINGTLEDTRSPSTDITLSYIGAFGTDATVISNCEISDIRIYDRVLPSTQITQLYDDGRFK